MGWISNIESTLDNSETLLASGATDPTGVGTQWWQKYTVVSSTITEATPVALSTVSSGGELAVEDVIFKTGSTGLAGGTDLQLRNTNAKGAALMCAETVANLGANKTVGYATASVTAGVKTVLEVGAQLELQSTGANCSGVGTVDIYILFRRLTAGATIS